MRSGSPGTVYRMGMPSPYAQCLATFQRHTRANPRANYANPTTTTIKQAIFNTIALCYGQNRGRPMFAYQLYTSGPQTAYAVPLAQNGADGGTIVHARPGAILAHLVG